MTFKKKTLRTMSPTARKVARLDGELDSVVRRLKNLIPELQRLDLDSRALESAKATDAKAIQVFINGARVGLLKEISDFLTDDPNRQVPEVINFIDAKLEELGAK